MVPENAKAREYLNVGRRTDFHRRIVPNPRQASKGVPVNLNVWDAVPVLKLSAQRRDSFSFLPSLPERLQCLTNNFFCGERAVEF